MNIDHLVYLLVGAIISAVIVARFMGRELKKRQKVIGRLYLIDGKDLFVNFDKLNDVSELSKYEYVCLRTGFIATNDSEKRRK